MTHKPFFRFVLLASFIFLSTLFFLVLTINALRTSTTTSATLPEGPYLVKDIYPGNTGSNPAPVFSVGDKALFFAYTEHGQALWKSDGTESGTNQITLTHSPRSYPTPQYSADYPEIMDDQLYFINNDGIHGQELWRSDGSEIGTMLVKDILTGTSGSNPYHLAKANNQLFFKASDGTHGYNLWTSDGTVTNTKMVTDLYYTVYVDLIGWNNKAYFAADDGIHGSALWTSDGTVTGTYMVKDINALPQLFFTTDNFIFFLGNGIWRTDGTYTGTISLQINTNYPTVMAATNKHFFTKSNDNIHGDELWVSDGTITGTHLVKDINPFGNPGLSKLYPFDESRVFFFANDGIHGKELWVSDGTEAGTYMIKDIAPGEDDSRCSYNQHMVNLNGTLFFTADYGGFGCELWRSDGTETGTYLVHDINPGEADSEPEDMQVFNNTVFFEANDGIHGIELWSLGNIAPDAKNDTAVITMNQSIAIPIIDNDFDINLNAINLVSTTEPAHGITTMVNQTVVYTPTDGFIGTDSFSYTIEDIGGLTAVAQVNITVTGYRTYLPIVVHQSGDR